MPGIKEDADIRPGKASGERMYLLIHFGLGEITALDDGKAEPAQCRSHVGGIVGRIVELRSVQVVRIANDKCDTLVRRRCGPGQQEKCNQPRDDAERHVSLPFLPAGVHAPG